MTLTSERTFEELLPKERRFSSAKDKREYESRLDPALKEPGLRRGAVHSSSSEETIEYGAEIGRGLSPGSILCFFGDLGAGKTTLIKGIAKGAGEISEREVSSPTFPYLHIYSGRVPVYHFDLYRLKNADEFCALGFDEYLNGSGICCIEWAERIEEILPSKTLLIRIEHESNETRKIWVY
ncbi:MAG: tRNA (adenosine(37)-N6)-threonylcarbamoyltransferase complex ATPase subunit type 1 TsaE [Chlamydiales bacterium]|nr:tRNA (adenosine(37)-N6)-threonylcarbamoyltransferase complex ATPase subunit type 1 TsaE [Chlamydiales bacterium]